MCKYPTVEAIATTRAQVDEACQAAVANQRLSAGEVNAAREEAFKAGCVALGAEVLTVAACAYLYRKAEVTVRQALRADPDRAVEFPLQFGGVAAREVPLLCPTWAAQRWPQPVDYAERLSFLRTNGMTMYLSSLYALGVLILSPRPPVKASRGGEIIVAMAARVPLASVTRSAALPLPNSTTRSTSSRVKSHMHSSGGAPR